jgi:HD-GYP domain-containing protein (c-di-GMP phosphodiesterase class II)/CHASE2 domain-containing sensor protein
MITKSSKFVILINRVLGTARGRPFAGLVLALVVAINFFGEIPPGASPLPDALARVVDILATPLTRSRMAVFDAYQKLLPRLPRSQPVTVVEVDEKSIAALGQWPWPRSQLAALVDQINRQGPAAIGLAVFMPEPDQTSPEALASRLPAQQSDFAQRLRAFPTHDALLAQALGAAPSVLGASGLGAQDSVASSLRSAPLLTQGANPLPFALHFPHVLASLPQLQTAARGQALLNVTAENQVVRRVPLLAAVGAQLAPGLAMEMLRVGTSTAAIGVVSGDHGIERLQLGNLAVPTQADGTLYLRFAPQQAGVRRTVSAVDVLEGRSDPQLLSGKMVLIGITGLGVGDLYLTALGEQMTGSEIHAQALEALVDGDLLLRPWWAKWAETAGLLLIGMLLIWFVPGADSGLAAHFKRTPRTMMSFALLLDLVFVAAALYLFAQHGLMLDAASFVLVFTLIVALLAASALIEGLGEMRTRLTRLVDTGILLGSERDRSNVLRQTLLAAKEMARCQGAALLLKTEHNTLRFEMRTGDGRLPSLELPLNGEDGQPNHRLLAAHVVLSGKTERIDDVGKERRFGLADTRALEAASDTRIETTLYVPLMSGRDKVLGILLLTNALDPVSEEVVAFDPRIVGFVEALAAQAAVALDNQNLVEAQKQLMDSMIQILAGAIDTKSPYTGGHRARVPELAFLLAEQACTVREGPLADFGFRDEAEWREFRIGAWLHDCGKVTTPEYVVDKATKLETIYNRIHEIRMRFEVLLRDREIERLTAVHVQGQDPAAAAALFAQRKEALLADFAFVAECNLGGEFMEPAKVERLQRLAQATWQRHFDDRLGLSHDERKRHDRLAAQALPATEYLLSDKASHLFERPATRALDPSHGFALSVPQYLYNHGELHNLSIGRGTLTEEERFKINEHIIQTIVMLEAMPLPPGLRRVPEYAGTHHETLRGTGYPRQLAAAQLSVPSRIMAIADIFEALTASDRPYKKAKTLSESIHILSGFKKEGHIDPTLFDLFLTSGVYRTYAQRFLQPAQIDEVDIAQYLG